MIKIILKYVGLAILVYPLLLIVIFLENSWDDNTWYVVIILLAIICSILCYLEIREKREKLTIKSSNS